MAPVRLDFQQGTHHALLGAGEASSSRLSRFFLRRLVEGSAKFLNRSADVIDRIAVPRRRLEELPLVSLE